MLKASLLKWCQYEFDHSNAGKCGKNCNNVDACIHDCDECLRQVHWFPKYGGRSDYDCEKLLLKYVLRYTDKYSSQIISALQHIDLSEYPQYHIFSIGCGAAPDLMAFEETTNGKQIYYKGYDRNRRWEGIHNKIEEYAENTDYIEAKLRQSDIFDVFSEGKPRHQQYNIVIIQYLLSHLYNTGQAQKMECLFDYIIRNVLSKRLMNSPFLIIITDIDSRYKGRNNWYILLDKLENAGCHGVAYARSAFSIGDLGRERWSQHKESPQFGNISYEYFQNASESEGAQLIIEVR